MESHFNLKTHAVAFYCHVVQDVYVKSNTDTYRRESTSSCRSNQRVESEKLNSEEFQAEKS